jgi:hypothetical protein
MILFLVLLAPLAVAAPIACYGLALRRSLPRTERPRRAWTVALVLLLGADVVLVLVFLFAIAVYNCHGHYECPF